MAPFEQSNMHHTLNFCPSQSGRKSNVPKLKPNKIRTAENEKSSLARKEKRCPARKEKTAFLAGISFHFWPFVFRWGFNILLFNLIYCALNTLIKYFCRL
jgi:hypothetical protein